MTKSVLAERSVLLGNQNPRIEWVPDGEDHPDRLAAIELVEAAGIVLDPWQQHVFAASLLRRGGKWSAMEVGVCCPRQNGKNALLEARELAGLFVLGEETIVHSAHLADTAKEAFRRLEIVLDANEWLSKDVRHIWRTNGHESIELVNGQRIRFRTRTRGGGRGFSGDLTVFDEAMIFPEESLGAIFPILSGRSQTGNPQAWYTGSAVDRAVHQDGAVFSRVRGKGLAHDESLAYFEWSLPYDSPADVPHDVAGDPDAWADANPALGIRIASAHVAKEQRSLSSRTFAVERLGVGDWYDDQDAFLIDPELWGSLAAEWPQADAASYAFDVSPDRQAAIAAAVEVNGGVHVDVVEHRRGMDWLPARLAEITDTAVCDPAGPAGALIGEIEALGVKVRQATAREHGQACGQFLDRVLENKLRHTGGRELSDAVRGAATRPLGDAWAWSRKNSGVDISPLVACTLALWASVEKKPEYRTMGFR